MFGPHLLTESMQCELCKKRIPVALAASGCEKNVFDYQALAEKIGIEIAKDSAPIERTEK